MSQLKAAVVGLGAIYPMHTKPLITMGVPIVAVCDKNMSLAKSVAKELGAKPYACYNHMLKDGGFDVLHICLPHYLHAEVAIAALKAGYHVLTEKPMATTVLDAEKMQAESLKSGSLLGVIFQNRYSPGANLIKETIAGGKLGAVKGGAIRVNWYRGGDYYTKSEWRGKWATEGGGVLINQSIHSFDMMNYFLGNPTHVEADIANRLHPEIEVEDVAEGVIAYGDIDISFYVTTFHPYNAPACIEVICENGSAFLLGEEAEITFLNGEKLIAGADKEAQAKFGMTSYWGVSHIKQIHDFYQSVKEGRPLAISGADGLSTQKLINGIYEAARSRQKVKL